MSGGKDISLFLSFSRDQSVVALVADGAMEEKKDGWKGGGGRRGASVLQRVIVRGQRWQKMSSTQWLIPDPMWFMAPPRLFCRSLWCHITQAVQTTSLISVLVNRKGGHTCAPTLKMFLLWILYLLLMPSNQKLKNMRDGMGCTGNNVMEA